MQHSITLRLPLLLVVFGSSLLACSGEDDPSSDPVETGGATNAGSTGLGGAGATAAAGAGTTTLAGAGGLTNTAGANTAGTASAGTGTAGSTQDLGGSGGTSPLDDEAGGSAGETATNASGGASGAASDLPIPTYDDFSWFLNQTCGGGICHVNPGQDNEGFEPNLIQDAGDDLYDTLMTVTVLQCDGLPLVTPGDPENSAIIKVVTKQCGALAMPFGCAEAPALCLFEEDIDMMRAWISAGAPRP